MKMIRTFLPIGQGGFCKETFHDGDDKLTFIYDCGTSTPDVRKRLGKYIHGAFEKNEVVEAVFLSHLDADHFNGLPELLKHCKVKNIFFPLLSDDEKLLLKIKLLFGDGAKTDFVFYYQFIDNPKAAIEQILGNGMQLPKLFRVKEVSNDNDNSKPSNDSSVTGSIQNTEIPADTQVIEFGDRDLETAFIEAEECKNIFSFWKYCFFNICQSSNLFDEFKAKLRDE